MSLTCTAIIGFLCVQAPIGGTTNIQLEDQGFWVGNTVQAKNWKASWGRSMEQPAARLDMARLDRGCLGKDCVAYWRRCDQKAVRCTFYFDNGKGYANALTVEAKDQTGLHEALTQLGIVVKWQPVTAVPLEALNKEGKGSKQPVCVGTSLTSSPPCHVPMD